jgi:hypothetical protein
MSDKPYRSTGPLTEEGKARSAQNALKHGLTSRQVVIPEGMNAEFDALHAALSEQIQPVGAMEEVLFRQLVHAAWSLERIRQLEAMVDLLDPQYALLLRYEAHHQRAFSRVMKALQTLQTLRAQQARSEEAAELPALAAPRNRVEVRTEAYKIAHQLLGYEELDRQDHYRSLVGEEAAASSV